MGTTNVFLQTWIEPLFYSSLAKTLATRCVVSGLFFASLVGRNSAGGGGLVCARDVSRRDVLSLAFLA